MVSCVNKQFTGQVLKQLPKHLHSTPFHTSQGLRVAAHTFSSIVRLCFFLLFLVISLLLPSVGAGVGGGSPGTLKGGARLMFAGQVE